MQQLDVGHQLQFPAILTYRYACDRRVVRLLRLRGLGNSSTQLHKKLTEQHHEGWLQKSVHYLADCQTFVKAEKKHLVVLPSFEGLFGQTSLPKPVWLMSVYYKMCCPESKKLKPKLLLPLAVFSR